MGSAVGALPQMGTYGNYMYQMTRPEFGTIPDLFFKEGTEAAVGRLAGYEALGPAGFFAGVGDIVGGMAGAAVGRSYGGESGAKVGAEAGRPIGSIGAGAVTGLAVASVPGAIVGAGVGAISYGTGRAVEFGIDVAKGK